nr:serine hydrolase domain-containing protein [uncultured Brevundimonas sp.]
MLDRRAVLAGAAALSMAGSVQAADEDARIGAIVVEYEFNGVILLGKDGVPTFQKAYGVADAGTGRPASVRDRYVIASISKWLTVTAILKLVEQNVMDLDGTVADGLPGFRGLEAGGVTLRQLLSNTSGIPNLYGPAVDADPTLKLSTMSAADAARKFCAADPVFTPGTSFDYAITNWILVAAMVEAATSQPFERVVDELVITPLRLPDTEVALMDFVERSDTAKAWASLSPAVLKMSPRPKFLAAAGGFCSTATDLLRAASGVFDTRLLAASSRSEMLGVTTPGQHYALGGRVARLATAQGERQAAWETGRTDGYRSVLGHILDDRRTVVVLNNTDLPQPMMDRIALRLLNADWA